MPNTPSFSLSAFCRELAALPQIEAIALGGSRAGQTYDAHSDYDIYLYCTQPVSPAARQQLLSRYCRVMEIGNHFWEQEDNCTLHGGVDLDLLYRDLDAFTQEVALVVEGGQPHNGYTTCMWHNLLTCRILFDRHGRLAAAKARFAVPYPEALRQNIVAHSLRLLHTALPAYDRQLAKAAQRGDLVSLNHRAAAFLEAYFDLLFALNRLPHPGEKRLMALAAQQCTILPGGFAQDIPQLLTHLAAAPQCVPQDTARLVDGLLALPELQALCPDAAGQPAGAR